MVVQLEVLPSGIGFDAIGEQELAVLVNHTADDLIACADGNGILAAVFCFAGNGRPVSSYIDGLAVPGRLDVFAAGLGYGEPVLPALPAEVAYQKILQIEKNLEF